MKTGSKAADMISCNEASVICNKKQYGEARFSERAQLLLHNLFCRGCLKFSRKNSRLTRMICQADLRSLSQEEKQSLKQQMEHHGSS